MQVPINNGNIKITSNYGNRKYYYKGKLIKGFHNGIDIVPSPCNNNEILAFADGVVTSMQKTGRQYATGCYVRIKHSNGLYTLYYHLKSGSVCVNVGDKVKKGQKLGIIGTTGKSTGIHLHFQIDKGSSKTSINPYDYLFNNKIFIEEKAQDIPKVNKPNILLMVKKTIRGDYGNGQTRKNKLGKYYNEVQHQVNLNYKNGTTRWDNIKLY